MEIKDIKAKVASEEYDFLRSDKNLGTHIMLLTLGGSHAYGMEQETSDVDVRGIAFNSKEDILLGTDFAQVVHVDTDTTIYSFNKMLKLLTACNPNTIEILGCKPEHYIYLTDIGKELIENRDMFLSQVCIQTFAEYASGQLRRAENKAARLVGQAQMEQHILKSIENASYNYKQKYFPYTDSEIKLYIDDAICKGNGETDLDKEIFMDINLKKYPLRDYVGLWNEMKNIVSSFNKFGVRNKKAVEHGKLGKHMAHLLRLYMMCIDLLERAEINTYRSDPTEHALLMKIRNGGYLDENRQPVKEFYDILNTYTERFEYAKKHNVLPEKPDYKRINDFKMYVNERVVRGDY